MKEFLRKLKLVAAGVIGGVAACLAVVGSLLFRKKTEEENDEVCLSRIDEEKIEADAERKRKDYEKLIDAVPSDRILGVSEGTGDILDDGKYRLSGRFAQIRRQYGLQCGNGGKDDE